MEETPYAGNDYPEETENPEEDFALDEDAAVSTLPDERPEADESIDSDTSTDEEPVTGETCPEKTPSPAGGPETVSGNNIDYQYDNTAGSVPYAYESCGS